MTGQAQIMTSMPLFLPLAFGNNSFQPLPLLQLGERFIAVISLVMRRNPKAALGTLNRHMVTGQDEDPGDSW